MMTDMPAGDSGPWAKMVNAEIPKAEPSRVILFIKIESVSEIVPKTARSESVKLKEVAEVTELDPSISTTKNPEKPPVVVGVIIYVVGMAFAGFAIMPIAAIPR